MLDEVIVFVKWFLLPIQTFVIYKIFFCRVASVIKCVKKTNLKTVINIVTSVWTCNMLDLLHLFVISFHSNSQKLYEKQH